MPDDRARGRAVAIWAAGASLALTAGPFVGGALITLVGWRSIFLVNLPIGLAGLWLSWRYASETTRSRAREIDLPGQLAAIGALGALAGAIIEGGALGWEQSSRDRSLRCGRRFRGALRLAREPRASQPMLPLSLFSHRHVRADLAGWSARQHRDLRPDLRAQPVFPEVNGLVGRSKPGLPSCR